MTYDKTTRKKILAYGETHSARAAIRKFSISSRTYYQWKEQAKKDYVKPERKQFYRKLDPEELKAKVMENPDLTTQELGVFFGVAASSVRRALIKLGFSFKKRSFSTSNETKQSEQNT